MRRKEYGSWVIIRLESKNPISGADLEWIFARNDEGTESLGFWVIISLHNEENRVWIVHHLSYIAVFVIRI